MDRTLRVAITYTYGDLRFVSNFSDTGTLLLLLSASGV